MNDDDWQAEIIANFENLDLWPKNAKYAQVETGGLEKIPGLTSIQARDAIVQGEEEDETSAMVHEADPTVVAPVVAPAKVLVPFQYNPAAKVSIRALVAEGQALQAAGVQYVVEGLIPAYPGLGFLVSRTKVGKTTLGMSLLRSIAEGSEFLGLKVKRRKVLMLSLEDPREYLAVLAAMSFRELNPIAEAYFYPESLTLDDLTLEHLAKDIAYEGFEFVYVATLLHAVRGRVKDENDNAGMACAIATLKHFARRAGVSVLFEAHAGKGEDQTGDADPTMALRGASAAAAEADYVLSLKRAGTGFTTARTLSGLGRFVSFEPLTFDWDRATGGMTVLSSGGSSVASDTDFRMILETGALDITPRTTGQIALAAGWVGTSGKVDHVNRDRVAKALRSGGHLREGVAMAMTGISGTGRGSRSTYSIATQHVAGGG